MKQNNSNMPLWYLIIIDDPNFLPGKSIYDVIKLFLCEIKFKFATVDYLSGAFISSLTRRENTIITVTDLLEELLHVEQFDWGNFFLFKESPDIWENQKNKDYPFVIAQTDTTIRAVDDQYIYVYTPYLELVDILKNNYAIESLTKGALNNMQFPE